jgi:hypothetical protein
MWESIKVGMGAGTVKNNTAGLCVQINQHFFKGIIPLGRYFPAEHSVSFLFSI